MTKTLTQKVALVINPSSEDEESRLHLNVECDFVPVNFFDEISDKPRYIRHADVWRTEKKGIASIADDIENCVVFFDGTQQNDVDEVARLAEEKGAAALLLIRGPTKEPPMIPTFWTTKKDMAQCEKLVSKNPAATEVCLWLAESECQTLYDFEMEETLSGVEVQATPATFANATGSKSFSTDVHPLMDTSKICVGPVDAPETRADSSFKQPEFHFHVTVGLTSSGATTSADKTMELFVHSALLPDRFPAEKNFHRYDIKNAIVQRDSDAQICNISPFCAGAILFFPCSVRRDIEALAKLVDVGNVAALICSSMPDYKPKRVPVWVTYLSNINYLEQEIECGKRTALVGMYSCEDDTEMPAPASPGQIAMDRDQKSCLNKQNLVTSTSNATAATKTESKGFVANVVGFVKDIFIGKKGWVSILKENDGWSFGEKGYKFSKAMETLDRVKDSDGKNILKEVEEAFLDLESYQITPSHIVFAAHLYNRTRSIVLAEAVIHHMRRCGAGKLAKGLLTTDVGKGTIDPRTILHDFFSLVAEDWFKLSSALTKEIGTLCAVVVIWIECRLLSRSQVSWDPIRRILQDADLTSLKEKLQEDLKNMNKTMTFLGLGCIDLESLRQLVSEYPSIFDQRAIIDRILKCMEDSFLTCKRSNDIIVRDYWLVLIKLISNPRLSTMYNKRYSSPDKRLEVLGEFVKQLRFETNKSFDLYIKFFDDKDLFESFEAELQQFLLRSVSDQLQNEFVHRLKRGEPLESSHFIRVLSSKAGRSSRKEFRQALMGMSRLIATHLSSTYEVLQLAAETLHAYSATTNQGFGEDLALDLIELSLERKKSHEELLKLISQWSCHHSKILQKSTTEFPKRIAATIFPAKDARVFVCNLDVLQEVVSLLNLTGNDFLLQPLRRQLDTVVQEALSSIEESTNFVVKFCNHFPEGLPEQFKFLAAAAFRNAFKEWNPESIGDIFRQDPDTLENLLMTFNLLPKEIENCWTQITGIIDTFVTSFRDNALVRHDVEAILPLAKKPFWSSFGSRCGYTLPESPMVEMKIREFDNRTKSICVVLARPSDPAESIATLLRGYNCFPEEACPIGRLLSRYSFLFGKDKNEKHGRLSFIENPFTGAQLSEDLLCAERFRDKFGDMIAICDYFLAKPSVLFRKGVSRLIKTFPDIDALQCGVLDARDSISNLLGSTSTFEEVDRATRIISESTSLDGELAILAGCSELHLESRDLERFRVVALMSQFVDPLENFVQFFRQFKYAVLDTDPDFEELAKITTGLKNGEFLSKNGDECKASSEQLLKLLINADEGDDREFSSRGKEYLPVISVLAHFSIHSELMTFVREMGWLGDMGLQKFHEEFENVTNMLVGNSISYEMTVLNALEPNVRVVSKIGSLSDEKSIANIVEKMVVVPEVHRLWQGGSCDEMKQVKANLSQIREWFTEGLDESAAVYGKFQAVKQSGKFYLEGSDVGTLELCLSYSPKEHNPEHLKGDALNRFIQYVSLLQNEDVEITIAISHFTEIYHLLKRAAGNFQRLSRLGFSGLLLKSFAFHFASDGIQEAQDLVSKSEDDLRNQEVNLKNLRVYYPTSVLFSTREMQHIYEKLSEKDDSDQAHLQLVNHLSRLLEKDCQLPNERLTSLVKEAMKGFKLERNNTGWMATTAHFINVLGTAYGENAISLDAEDSIKLRRSRIVLHTLAVEKEYVPKAIFDLIRILFDTTLPRDFQVIDANHMETTDDLDIFLQRSKSLPTLSFVLMNVDSLSGFLVEHLINILSNRTFTNSGLKIHFIQRASSLLHAGQWIDSKVWDKETFASEERKHHELNHAWKNLLLDGIPLVKIGVVWTVSSGTGKTHFISRKLRKMENNYDAQVASILIHEKSDLSSLVEDLSSNFRECNVVNGLHLSFCYAPTRSEESSAWLDMINEFFFGFIVLRRVQCKITGRSFYLGRDQWRLYIELPSTVDIEEWLSINIPVLAFCEMRQTPPSKFLVDAKTRRVCTYLRAFRDGTINRKFQSLGRCISFVLDWSGSMNGRPINVATDNALKLFDSHVNIGDQFGATMFDHETREIIPIQEVKSQEHKSKLRVVLDGVRTGKGGGTNMYHALSSVFNDIRIAGGYDHEVWVVCLTDGASADRPSIELVDFLRNSSDKLHLIVVGIGLPTQLEAGLRRLCGKYNRYDSESFIPSHGDIENLNRAFAAVANRIPVSQTFELLDGVVSDAVCNELLNHFTSDFISDGDMLTTRFFVEFLYRRVMVFDNNIEFNENTTYDNLGSTLMATMLEEVQRLLRENQSRDWSSENHAQLIYDYTDPRSPKFRLVCTAPEQLPANLKRAYQRLDLPGFSLPSTKELSTRGALHCFLSQALAIPLTPSDSGEEMLLYVIMKSGFILTLDFMMKLLNIHERVVCGVPCIIEGETGVSKTALTKVYAELRNSAAQSEARSRTGKALSEIEKQVLASGYEPQQGSSPAERLHKLLKEEVKKSIGDESQIAGNLIRLLQEKVDARHGMFQPCHPEWSVAGLTNNKAASDFLGWFGESRTEPLFFDICVDASLTEADFVVKLERIRTIAQKVSSSGAIAVVFFDEINTSSVMGFLKGIVMDRVCRGEKLEPNIVVIAACNPFRPKNRRAYHREDDLGKEWIAGHYQVLALPQSMERVKWAFGSLTEEQEKDFIYRRLEQFQESRDSSFPRRSMTELIASSQVAMRMLAEESLIAQALESERELLPNAPNRGDTLHEMTFDAKTRSKSVVSLRDIQRVFSLYEFFTRSLKLGVSAEDNMTLSVAMVYYLRLDTRCREKYLQQISYKRKEKWFIDVLRDALKRITENTRIPEGIAITEGLKENIFATLVCLLSRTPLMIIGPPGCSKTLSVNIVADNANGEDSAGDFYATLPRLSLFHYQCSRGSTSKEIGDVFSKASSRQDRLDSTKHQCFVFMDEAGLPEEGKESLKILHYLLEGHMSAKPNVGFVAISNHVLDAAKSNRCAVLLRQELDSAEMLRISHDVLFGSENPQLHQVVIVNNTVYDPLDFAKRLASSFESITQSDKEFENFFGLRDYIYMLKALRECSKSNSHEITITTSYLVRCIERNFNGLSKEKLGKIILKFLEAIVDLSELQRKYELMRFLREPLDVITDAIISNTRTQDHCFDRPRFKLLIDRTEDDSIMRLLGALGIVNFTRDSLYKLSKLGQEEEVEQMRVVSAVKFAALQGKSIFLSQVEQVHEAMYDLFNVRFREVGGKQFVNIAVGGISRRCLVKPSFECIVQVRESQMKHMPAPFLNRFEKYTIGIGDVKEAGFLRLGGLRSVFARALSQVSKFVAGFGGSSSFYGPSSVKTIESILIDMLPKDAIKAPALRSSLHPLQVPSSPCSFAQCLSRFLSMVSSISDSVENILPVIPHAMSLFSDDKLETELTQDMLFDKLFNLLRLDFKRDASLEFLATILEMAISRIATLRLLQVSFPESLFVRSRKFSAQIVEHYIAQEHFSLKALLSRKTNESMAFTKLIVGTRSDGLVNNLPSHSSSHPAANLESIEQLICEDASTVTVQHLSSLRSDTLLRASMQAWIDDRNRSTYVLVFDMREKNAIDHVNFARTLLEQLLALSPLTKVIALVLHYPTSALRSRSQYPVLFLNGWDHYFLDSVGEAGPRSAVDSCIKMAYRSRVAGTDVSGRKSNANDTVLESNADDLIESLADVLLTLIPRNVTHSLSKVVLTPSDQKNFSSSSSLPRIVSFFRIRIGDESIGSILCRKFSLLWVNTELSNTVNRAAENLALGKTQLSISLSVKSTLLDTFEAFIVYFAKEMNLDQSLEQLSDNLLDPVYSALFKGILSDFPVAPLHELLLLRSSPAKLSASSLSVFPFFAFVFSGLSDLFDQALTETRLKTADQSAAISARNFSVSMKNELDKLLNQDEAIGVSNPRLRVLRHTLNIVESDQTVENSLFERYICDLVTWKMSGKKCQDLVLWLHDVTSEAYCNNRNLLDVHIVLYVRQEQFTNLASWHFSNLPMARTDSGGQQILSSWIGHFETSLFQGGHLCRKKWADAFARFLQHIPLLFPFHDGPLHQKDSNKLRALSFIFVLISCEVGHEGMKAVAGMFYDLERSAILPEVVEGSRLSISDFISSILQSDGADVEAIAYMTFKHMFSPIWIGIVAARNEDFTALLDTLDNGLLLDSRRSARLLNAASAAFAAKGQEKLECNAMPTLLQQQIEKMLTRSLGRNAQSEQLPHSPFVPQWLRRLPCDSESGQVYDYHWTNCIFADTVFWLYLEHYSNNLSSFSSEAILLDILDEMEAGKCGAATHIERLSIDTKILLFLATIADELVTSDHSRALQGTYREDGMVLFDNIMKIKNCRWDDFFFHMIMRASGEGTMSKLLNSSILTNVSISDSWRHGEAGVDACDALANAEKALADAVKEEEEKSRTTLLCPHCQSHFMVDARNCGQFTCGSDAHGGVGGVPVLGGYGCGRTFALDSAPRYISDASILEPYRNRLDTAASFLKKCKSSQQRWDVAKNMDVPPFLLSFDRHTTTNSIIPNAYLTSQLSSDKEHKATKELLERLLQGSDFMPQLHVLPDMIELYLWIHTTFKFLISRSEAATITLDEIFNERKLLTRFDCPATKRLVARFRNMSENYLSAMVSCNYTVYFGCDEIKIPFKRLGDAKLLTLLSEGEHPTDGNDFLFLIINAVIERYNSFSRWLNENRLGVESDKIESDSLDPHFITRGRYGAIAACTGVHLSRQALTGLLTSYWESTSSSFDLGCIERDIKLGFNLHIRRPVIRDPLKHLRERFVFRADVDNTYQAVGRGTSEIRAVPFDGQAIFFANEQDAALFTQASRAFKEERRFQGSRDYNDILHSFEYEDLRSFLKGMFSLRKEIFQKPGGKETIQSEVCTLFGVTPQELLSKRELILSNLGFPLLTSTQFDFFLSLDPDRMAGMARFTGKLLATEAYQYSHRPLCLKQPLQSEAIEFFDHSFSKILDERGLKESVNEIEIFVRDVLNFYERIIEDEASKSDRPLRDVLNDFNCCDSLDNVLQAISGCVSCRNYVPLCCFLQQRKLAWIFSEAQSLPSSTAAASEPAKENECWYWQQDVSEPPSAVQDSSLFRPCRPEELLWFAKGFEISPTQNETLDSASGDTINQVQSGTEKSPAPEERNGADEGAHMCKEELAARVIQTRCRRFLHGYDGSHARKCGILFEATQRKKSRNKATPRSEVRDAMMFNTIDADFAEKYNTSATHLSNGSPPPNVTQTEEREVLDEHRGESKSNGGAEASITSGLTYGSTEEIQQLREWICGNNLPESVFDEITELGVRNIEDVGRCFELREPELREAVSVLDFAKLKAAINTI